MSTPRSVLMAVIPAALVCVAYLFLLSHRGDYLGHFAAGYGGTLGLIVFTFAVVPRKDTSRHQPLYVLTLTLFCILLGTLTEATVFRIAQFDPVDWFNQSLGAVLASLAFLAARLESPIRFVRSASLLIVATLFLALGFYYALM